MIFLWHELVDTICLSPEILVGVSQISAETERLRIWPNLGFLVEIKIFGRNWEIGYFAKIGDFWPWLRGLEFGRNWEFLAKIEFLAENYLQK